MKIISTCLIICLLCPTISDGQSTSPPRVKKSWVKNYELQPGRHAVSIPINRGENWNAYVSISTIEEGQKVPLILALHWAGREGAQKEYADCLAFPALEHLGGIIVTPSAEGEHWVSDQLETRVIDLVKQISKYWPIDPDRILITSYSNGGIGTWHYIKKYPRMFTFGIAMAGFYKPTKLKYQFM